MRQFLKPARDRATTAQKPAAAEHLDSTLQDKPPGRDQPGDRQFRKPRYLEKLADSDLVMMSMTFVGFVLLFVVGYGPWLGRSFYSVTPRVFDIYQNTPSLLLSVGVVACLACGQFDLSAGGIASLSMMLTIGVYLQHGVPMIASFAISIVVGMAIGLVNGIAITRFRVHAFIATLATGGIADGLSNLYSGGSVVAESPGGRHLPSWFSGPRSFGSFTQKAPLALSIAVLVLFVLSALFVARERFLLEARRRTVAMTVATVLTIAVALLAMITGVIKAFNWQIVILALASWALWLVMRYTPLGRRFHATGLNPTAAHLAGIHIDRVTLYSFVLSGMFASVAGICLAANQSSATPGAADSYLLPAYAAVFLSTVMFSAGKFNVWGTVAGGICLVYVGEGFAIGGLQFSWSTVIDGVVLLLAVSLSSSLRRSFRR
jgi:ABC-type xylose transport system, permease component